MGSAVSSSGKGFCMNIAFLPVRLTSINFKSASKNQSVNFTCKGDTFEKSVKKGSFEEFDNWRKENNYDSKKILETISNPKNEIGHGANHVVYEIEDCPNFVLRIPIRNNLSSSKTDNIEFEKKENQNPNNNIEQTVGYINFYKNNNESSPDRIEIARRVSGKSYGVPDPTVLYGEKGLREGELPYDSPERAQQYRDLLDIVSHYDDEVFSDLIEKIDEIYDAGYSIDCLNPNNFLLANNEINIIDLNKSSVKPDYFDILYALTNIQYLNTYNPSCIPSITEEDKNVAINETQIIIDKFFKAMERNGIKADYDNRTTKADILFQSLPFKMHLFYNGYRDIRNDQTREYLEANNLI